MARNIVYQYGKQENLDPKILSAFSKRILLNRSDFYNSIKMNMVIEQQYIIVGLNMLEPNILKVVDSNL